jgi:branched-chain amino acid transport system substrate-binding protein
VAASPRLGPHVPDAKPTPDARVTSRPSPVGNAKGGKIRTGSAHGVKALVGGLLAVGLLVGACGNAQTTVSHAGDTDGVYPNRIVVGGLASETGPLPAFFAPVLSGAQAYIDMVNEAGGVNGRKIDFAYKLDDQSSPSVNTSQARTLVDQDRVFAVVAVATPSFSGASYLASHNVPTFGLNVNPNSQWLAGPSMFGNTGSFTNFTAPVVTAAFLAEQHRVHAAAVLSYNVAQSQQGCQGVLNSFNRYRVPIAFRDTSIPAPATDLHADVTRMKEKGVDMVVSCMDIGGNILLSNTMQQAGLQGVTNLWFDGYDQSAVQHYASAMQGVYFLLDHVPFEVTDLYPGVYPGMDQFQAMLKRYEPDTSLSEAALAGWTSADLFVTGLRAIGRDVTRERLVRAINQLGHFTANGAISPVDWRTGHQPVDAPINCTAFVQVQNGRFVPVYGTPPSVFSCYPVPAPSGPPVRQVVPLPPGVPPQPAPPSG